MNVRAKFEVVKVSEFGGGGKRSEISVIKSQVPANTPDSKGVTVGYDRTEYESSGVPMREITLSAVGGGSEENRSFATNTPSGTITFQLNNAAMAEAFKPGQAYYVDFTPVEK